MSVLSFLTELYLHLQNGVVGAILRSLCSLYDKGFCRVFLYVTSNDTIAPQCAVFATSFPKNHLSLEERGKMGLTSKGFFRLLLRTWKTA